MPASLDDAAVGADEGQDWDIVALGDTVQGLQNRGGHLHTSIDHDGQGTDGIHYFLVFMEEVIEAQPDVILLPSEPFHFTTEHVQLFSELDVPAARNKRIILVDGSLLTWHGTRIAYALNTLPDLLYAPGEV